MRRGAPAERVLPPNVPDHPVQRPELVKLGDLHKHVAELWPTLAPGSCVWLSGDLGSGKTTFVQALTEQAGASLARSPTFALVHEYPGTDGTIVHVDCFRLREPEEAIELDLLELQRDARLLLIEWPERAGQYAPPADIHLRFSHADDADTRWLQRVG